MKSNTSIDYAIFQLSPKCSRCELFVSSDGNTEKLASGLVKPFVTHLKVVEEQVAQAVQSIKLEVERNKNAESWFTKGTLERFVRFVSTPEVLDLVNKFDAEMSQLEAARIIYSQGKGDQHTGGLGVDGTGTTPAADATKKELLRAIDVRLVAVRQDLTTACAHATAAGFNPNSVSELQHFADHFGGHHLNEACTKFISLCQRRPDLISWKLAPGGDERDVRSSYGSDMSIDDPTEEQAGSHIRPQQPHNMNSTSPEQRYYSTEAQHHLDQSKSSTWQQPNSFTTFSSQRSNVNEKDEAKKEETHDVAEKKKEGAGTESSSTPASQPSRRLSVQDRISLFESKQKENSTGSGGKPIVGKSVELRRLSSGSTIPEKAVLRRWSGASDMIIDVSGEKKDTESPLCTPSCVSTAPQPKSNIFTGGFEDKDPQILRSSGSSNAEPRDKEEVGLKAGTGWKDQLSSHTQPRSSTSSTEQVRSSDQEATQEKSKISAGVEEKSAAYNDPLHSESQLRFSSNQEIVGLKTQIASQTHLGAVVTKLDDIEYESEYPKAEDAGIRNQPVAQSRFRVSHNHSRSLSGQYDNGILRSREASSGQLKVDDSAQFTPQSQWKSFTGELGEVSREDPMLSTVQQIKGEDSEVHKMKYQKPVSGSSEQIKKSTGKRDMTRVAYENNKLDFPVNELLGSQDKVGVTSAATAEQVQRVRQSKGNQELNDELKMKANELEKLFAEHKLRVPGDQSSSARKAENSDASTEQTERSRYQKPAAVELTPPQLHGRNTVIEPTGSSSNVKNSYTSSLVKMVENHNYGDALRRSFSEFNYADDSRGKFYEMYMQKRDAKLREEWISNRVRKEAKMKAMEDSLEQSRAEMEAKFSGSLDRQDSVSNTGRRAEKLRSFNFRSNIKKDQHPIDSLQNEEVEDLPEFSEEKFYGQDMLFSDSSFGNGASRSIQSKKILPNRNMSSSTPRTTAVSIPHSSAKVSSSSSVRRRVQSDNPLAQSVPNLSDLRKENTKPAFGAGKITSRSQVRSYSRSKSTNEETPGIKEEKPKRSQSLRKSSATPAEFKDMPLLNSDGVVLEPLKFEMEQLHHVPYDQLSNNMDSRPFLRKGNGIGPAGVGVVKMKASLASETSKNEEELDELTYEAEDLVDMAEEEEDELENMDLEDCTNLHNGKVTLSEESDKSGNSGSEIGDSTRSLSQVDPASVTEMPTGMVSTFSNLVPLQDSPFESPISWNSRLHHPFSYPHETADVDASVDSPVGSPAPWNSHGLIQTEADAARMRKKWGSAQKPILVNSSHNQSRKDVTKGFKRLLKFGRKSRGTESFVDWISATTSEGDDDTEDGRDPANRSSEDLRKSRMGFCQGLPSDDSFNESELFSEHVQSLQSSIPAPPANFKLRDDHISGSSLKAPRSFFSLSSFRSKGSDSKPR
ncbi:COP1-interacting protein 7 [Quillaja saponaria]|uniref:COP1-interacting protein 7 n=1 Tax=Quillaja saponaria TaxID=32244 RepID=A0AAD7PE47_QUISA|nr:COP1-interacting protein 7 [Quillaja saponaria]